MNHSDLTGSFMLKLLYQLGIMNTRIYWAHEYTKEMDAGGRISLKKGDLELGGSVIWENFEHDHALLHYELDLQYELFSKIDLAMQFSIVDDGIASSDDLKAFAFTSFKAGDIFRYFKQTSIYVGIDTSEEFEESTKLAGINFKPIAAAFVKAEYQRSSLAVIDESLEFQLGFVF